MPRSIPCPACSAKLVLPDKLPDNVKSVRCPQCKASMSVVKKTPTSSTQLRATPTAQTQTPPRPSTSPRSTSHAPAPATDTAHDDLLGDLSDVRLAGEEPPIPAGQSAAANVAPVETADELLTPIEVPENDDHVVPVEAADASNELVEVEAVGPGVGSEIVETAALAVEEVEEVAEVEEVEEIEELDELEEVEEDRRRERLPGLLGHDEFLIKPKAAFSSLHYDIQDYKSRDVLGTASEERGVVGFFVGRKAANIVMHDDLRDKPLCTLYRPMSLLSSRVEIRDHKERMLGTVAFRMVQFLGATIYDWDDREWATIKGKWGAVPAMHIKDPDGKTLGKFTHEAYQTKKVVVTFFTKGMSWYVKVNKRIRYDHDAKLLLLASAIAYDMVRISREH